MNNMFNPKVSIIIPVYNGSDYLSEAIDSALSQSYKNIEILVINDGSNDNGKTEKVAKSYKNKIKYFYKKNGGVASALNLGIKEMSGEYFSWLSHDDLYFENKIKEQIKFLEKVENKNYTILSSDYIFIDGKNKEIKKIKLDFNEKNIVYKLFINSFLNGCTLLINKKVFENIGVFENKLKHTQDYHLWFRIIKKYKIVNISKYLVKSRQHSKQDSKAKFYQAIKERRQLENFIFETYTLNELKKSASSKLPNSIFYIITKIKLEKYRILGFLYMIAQKLNMDLFLANIYRKIFKY